MADLQRQLHEDRMLRDAAKRLVKNDMAHVKGDVSRKGLGTRFVDRTKDGVAELADTTGHYADTHRAQLGTGLIVGVAALAGWIFRDQLAEAVYDLFHDKSPLEQAADKVEQVAQNARSYLD